MTQRLKRRWCIYLCVFMPALAMSLTAFTDPFLKLFAGWAGNIWMLAAIAPAYLFSRWAYPDAATAPPTATKSRRRDVVFLMCAAAYFMATQSGLITKALPLAVHAACIVMVLLASFTINELIDARDEKHKAD